MLVVLSLVTLPSTSVGERSLSCTRLLLQCVYAFVGGLVDGDRLVHLGTNVSYPWEKHPIPSQDNHPLKQTAKCTTILNIRDVHSSAEPSDSCPESVRD